MPGITLTQAQAQLDLWMTANSRVATGQSYSIGGRSLSRVDAAEIREQIDYWDAKVKQLSASGSGMRRTRYVTPLDG